RRAFAAMHDCPLDAPASRGARACDTRRPAGSRQAGPLWRENRRNAVRPGVVVCQAWRILMGFWRQTFTIAGKDLRAELRSKAAINAALSFSVTILLLFSFAFVEDTTVEIAGGLLWIVFAFAGALILNRSFARELPNDCLDALI